MEEYNMKNPTNSIYSKLVPGEKYSLRDIMSIGYSEEQIRRYFNSYNAVFNFYPDEKIIPYERVMEFIRNIDGIYNCSNNTTTHRRASSALVNHTPEFPINNMPDEVNIFRIPQYRSFDIPIDIRLDDTIDDQLSSAIDKLRADIESANKYLKVLTSMYDFFAEI